MAGRVLYLDLDTVVVGSLGDVAGYSGTFAALSVEGMANELRPTGLNSSVMSWDASREAPTVRAVHGLLKEAYAVVSAAATTPKSHRLCVIPYDTHRRNFCRVNSGPETRGCSTTSGKGGGGGGDVVPCVGVPGTERCAQVRACASRRGSFPGPALKRDFPASPSLFFFFAVAPVDGR